MGVIIPNPESVDTELIAAVCESVTEDGEVTIKTTDNDRPGVLRVHSGTVHGLTGFNVVGISNHSDYSLVHVEEDD